MSITFDEQIKNDYFNWLYNYVCKGRSHDKISYSLLLKHLHQIEFTYIISNDVNRAKDGVDLRYRFAMTNGYDNPESECDIYTILNILDGPCSVLEMMVALAVRCEETIMHNTDYGDRTGQWFWGMMSNLGIGPMFNDIYVPEHVDNCINIFLNREYKPDGNGGLFYIRECIDDLRYVDIWTQLCWYLDNYT